MPRSDPDKIDVNVRCLDGVDIAALTIHQFDGRNWEHAMAERVPWDRCRRWLVGGRVIRWNDENDN